MKKLYLLRHAHAAPPGLGFSDFDRPLDERGQEEAKTIAQYIQKKDISFDFVMCSSALRAQETLEPLRHFLGTSDIEISENFYNTPEDNILFHLHQVTDDKAKILYIGHNPGIAFSILKFVKTIPPFLIEGLTPGTLTGLQFSLSKWMDLEWGNGEVIEVFQPSRDEREALALQES